MLSVRKITLAIMTLLAPVAALPLSASAAGNVPFQATLVESVVSALPCPGLPSQYLCVTVTGRGHATIVGDVTESMTVTVDTSSSPAPGCFSESRTSTLTTSAGDQVTQAGPGVDCGIATAHGTANDSWTVSGGTGSLAGATGSGTNTASIHEKTVPITSVTIFSGTLTP
jgi:hypothetical protein